MGSWFSRPRQWLADYQSPSRRPLTHGVSEEPCYVMSTSINIPGDSWLVVLVTILLNLPVEERITELDKYTGLISDLSQENCAIQMTIMGRPRPGTVKWAPTSGPLNTCWVFFKTSLILIYIMRSSDRSFWQIISTFGKNDSFFNSLDKFVGLKNPVMFTPLNFGFKAQII